MNNELNKPRLLFLDNIKVLFIILVIFQHARVTYGGTGWWYYIEFDPSLPLDLMSSIVFQTLTNVGGLFQSSLLGLFFLMGGYFTPASYDRKGILLFWKERLRRLGIPLLLYIVLFNPFIVYILAHLGIEPFSANPLLQGSLLKYYVGKFQTLDGAISFLTFYGPMWFLLGLLIFTGFYTLWRQFTKSDSIRKHIPQDLPIPKYSLLLLFAVILGCFTFVFRLFSPIDKNFLGLPFGYMVQYSMMFSFGVIAMRYEWFGKISRKQTKVWSITIVTTIALFYVYFFIFLGMDADLSVLLGGPNLHAFLFAVLDNIICMGMIFILIPIFYRKYNTQGTLMRNLSASAFHMYLIHPPILVLISLGFVFIPLFPAIKLAIVFPLAVILSYQAGRLIIRRTLRSSK